MLLKIFDAVTSVLLEPNRSRPFIEILYHILKVVNQLKLPLKFNL